MKNIIENINKEIETNNEIKILNEEIIKLQKDKQELHEYYSALERETHLNRLGNSEEYYKETISRLTKRINDLVKIQI